MEIMYMDIVTRQIYVDKLVKIFGEFDVATLAEVEEILEQLFEESFDKGYDAGYFDDINDDHEFDW